MRAPTSPERSSNFDREIMIPRKRPVPQPCNPEVTGRCGISQTISREILWRRNLRGMSQTELAKRSGVSRKTLNAVESGQQENLHVRTLVRLANALKVTPNGLLGYSPNPREMSGIVRVPPTRERADHLPLEFIPSDERKTDSVGESRRRGSSDRVAARKLGGVIRTRALVAVEV